MMRSILPALLLTAPCGPAGIPLPCLFDFDLGVPHNPAPLGEFCLEVIGKCLGRAPDRLNPIDAKRSFTSTSDRILVVC